MRTNLKAAAWTASITAVLLIGIVYFPREYDGLSFWEALYSTLRLFVFERDLDPFPKSMPLIFIYFAAPLITVSAVGTAITYLIRMSPGFRTRWMNDHVVICGVGRTGKVIAETLEKRKVRAVGVDVGPPELFAEWIDGHRTPMIFGDFHHRPHLEKAGAQNARTIIFASGNDLINLEGAVGAYEWLREEAGPPRLIWVHIANEKLAETARGALRTGGNIAIRFFDTYRIAAGRMIARHFSRESRRGVSEVTILGFGKFGRDLFEVLTKDLGPDEKFPVNIIDVADRKKEVCALAAELGITDRVHFSRAAIQDLDLVDEADKAFFLCTDDDLGNLTGAMQLAGKAGGTHIYVRMTHWPLSAVAEHLGEDRGVTFVNINELVVQGLSDLPGIFEPARKTDLKRTGEK